MNDEVILRFDDVSFEYQHDKPLLDEANFSIHRGSKITLMGQNGAGKSTLFNLITGKLKPKSGRIIIGKDISIATARQVMKRDELELTILEYFAKAFKIQSNDFISQVHKVLAAVNLEIPTDRKVGHLSGGQQARLLLAFALIQNSDILLLDEPTNNLDQAGIDHLIQFLMTNNKTVIVISHDADFLNCFTEGVIYLNVFTHKIESYVGNYYAAVEEISRRVEQEQRKNAQLKKSILDRKEKANFFANKGGKMRTLAKKLKDEAYELEDEIVDIRHEDRTIRDFNIPVQDYVGEMVQIDALTAFRNHETKIRQVEKTLKKRMHFIVTGPNGIGKSTLLRSLVAGENQHAKIMDGVKVGYYSQDFSNLDFNQTVFDSLMSVKSGTMDIQTMRSVAAGFLISGDMMSRKIGELSEGQKGLLAFARITLMQPGLLILDEPTNHINFRHLPVIAKAVNEYKGALLMVSHMAEFVNQINFDDELNLGKI